MGSSGCVFSHSSIFFFSLSFLPPLPDFGLSKAKSCVLSQILLGLLTVLLFQVFNDTPKDKDEEKLLLRQSFHTFYNVLKIVQSKVQSGIENLSFGSVQAPSISFVKNKMFKKNCFLSNLTVRNGTQ